MITLQLLSSLYIKKTKNVANTNNYNNVLSLYSWCAYYNGSRWYIRNILSILMKSHPNIKYQYCIIFHSILQYFFHAAVTSILLYGCTTWTLTKRLEKKLDGNYTRMLRAILNKSWRQHPTRHQLYGHLPPIQVRRTRHAGHCWDELISDVLLWTPTHGRAKAGRPARTYIQQLCEDTGCCPEDLPGAMNDREGWRERVRDIRATSATWWWWWWYYNKTHLSIVIFTVILDYHSTLAYLYLQIITLFYFLQNAMMIFCSLVIMTSSNTHTST